MERLVSVNRTGNTTIHLVAFKVSEFLPSIRMFYGTNNLFPCYTNHVYGEEVRKRKFKQDILMSAEIDSNDNSFIHIYHARPDLRKELPGPIVLGGARLIPNLNKTRYKDSKTNFFLEQDAIISFPGEIAIVTNTYIWNMDVWVLNEKDFYPSHEKVEIY